MPLSVPLFEHTLVVEHADELLGEERVSLRRGHDPVEHVHGSSDPAAEVGRDHRLALLAVERGEDDACRASARCPSPGLTSTSSGRRGADDHHLRVVDGGGELIEELEQRGLGPVHVLHDEEHRPLATEVLEEAADSPEELLDRERLGARPIARCEPAVTSAPAAPANAVSFWRASGASSSLTIPAACESPRPAARR